MPTITISDHLTVPLGRKACYGTIAVDVNRFSEAVQRHIYDYGLRQILNDAMADKKAENGDKLPDDEIAAKAHARLKTLYAGELRARRETAEPTDPVELEAFKIAKAAMTEAYKANGAWKDVPKGTKDRFAALIQIRRAARGMEAVEDNEAVAQAIQMFIDAHPEIEEQAVRNVAEREERAKAALDTIGML